MTDVIFEHMPKRGSHICRYGHVMVHGHGRWWCPACSRRRTRARRSTTFCACGQPIGRYPGKPKHTECFRCRRTHRRSTCGNCRAPLVGKSYCNAQCEWKHRKAMERAKQRPTRVCAGHEGHVCLKPVRKGQRCGTCQAAHQREVEYAMLSAPVEPGPKMCPVVRRGQHCGEALLFQVNRDGRLVTWCPVHGEKIPAVIRPTDSGYPQVA